MSVLYVPVVPPPPPSHQARELAEQLEEVIADYQATHPSTSARDVRYALMLAQRRSARVGGVRIAFAAAGIACAIGAIAAVMARSGGIHLHGSAPVLAVGILVLVLALLVGVTRRRP